MNHPNDKKLSDIFSKRKQQTGNPFEVVFSKALYPEKDDGKPLDTFRNLEWLLNHFNTEIKYNLMSRRREIYIPNQEIFFDDMENAALNRVNYLATINGMPTKQLDKHLDALAFEKPYHPIVDCIKEFPWDGIKRLDDFIKTIETADDSYSHPLIRTWMIATIAAAHSKDGFINQGVLVLQGDQNLGKTRWVKSLDPINCNAVKEGAILDPANKDSVILLARHWIVELGELDATFRKADIARLKSFITMQADDVRFAYAAKETRLARRTTYIATVNDDNFLSDDTGNRRWWTISVKKINNDHDFNMIQVWAEAFLIWKKGELAYLSTELQAKVNQVNLEHEKIDPLKEKLLSRYDWESTPSKWMSATEVLEELGFTKPNRADATRMGKLLKMMCNGKERVKDGYRKYQIPLILFKSGSF